MAGAAATDPRVIDCLAAYLVKTDSSAARAFHLTCRNAATAIKRALHQLSLCGKRVDLAALTYNFPAVEQLCLRQCMVATRVCTHA